MNEDEMMITLKLSVHAVNKILNVLGNSPFIEVANLITTIKMQGEQQLKETENRNSIAN